MPSCFLSYLEHLRSSIHPRISCHTPGSPICFHDNRCSCLQLRGNQSLLVGVKWIATDVPLWEYLHNHHIKNSSILPNTEIQLQLKSLITSGELLNVTDLYLHEKDLHARFKSFSQISEVFL